MPEISKVDIWRIVGWASGELVFHLHDTITSHFVIEDNLPRCAHSRHFDGNGDLGRKEQQYIARLAYIESAGK